MNVDEVVNGFVTHAAGRILGVASRQGDLDLLGCGTRGQKLAHFGQQGGCVRDFVAGGLRRPTASPALRLHAAVGLAPPVAGNLAVDDGGVSFKLTGDLRPAFTLGQTDTESLSFLSAKTPLRFNHQPKATRMRPRRQQRTSPSTPPTIKPNIKRIALIIVLQANGNHSRSTCALGVRLRHARLRV
jgi:hypothetical protein